MAAFAKHHGRRSPRMFPFQNCIVYAMGEINIYRPTNECLPRKEHGHTNSLTKKSILLKNGTRKNENASVAKAAVVNRARGGMQHALLMGGCRQHPWCWSFCLRAAWRTNPSNHPVDFGQIQVIWPPNCSNSLCWCHNGPSIIWLHLLVVQQGQLFQLIYVFGCFGCLIWYFIMEGANLLRYLKRVYKSSNHAPFAFWEWSAAAVYLCAGCLVRWSAS